MKFKKVINGLWVAALLGLLLAGNAVAKEDEKKEGFSGFVFLGVAYTDKEMSLDDASEDKNQSISSFNQSTKNESEFSALVTGALNYRFKSGTTIGFGDADHGLALYVMQEIKDVGSIYLGVTGEEEDVYSDPFVVGSARVKTDKESFKISLGWEKIMQSAVSVAYSINSIDIENDISGKRDSNLKRDGEIHTLDVSALVFENETHEFGAGIAFSIADMSGKSYSNAGVGLELFHTYKGNKWDVQTGVSVKYAEYDGRHSEFNKTREDTFASLGSSYTLYDPFGFEDFFISVFATYSQNGSNINFYDSSELITGMGVGYSF